MADEYIKREDALNILKAWGYCGARNVVNRIDAADVRPVVRGRWEKDKEDLKWGSSLVKRFCSNCKGRAYFDREKYEFVLTDFCYNCGADMREAQNGDG